MLVAAAARLPIGPAWSYELKWDGYRAIATIVDGVLELRSKNGTIMTAWFPELALLAAHVIVDLSLAERRAILRAVLHDALPLVLISKPFFDGAALLEEAERLGLEGVVAKREDSTNVPGDRSRAW